MQQLFKIIPYLVACILMSIVGSFIHMSGVSEKQPTGQQQVEALFNEISKLDVLSEAVGYALCAAELAKADLEERLEVIKTNFSDMLGKGVMLGGISEVFMVRDDQAPRRLLKQEGRTPFSAAGILRGLVVFDRAKLDSTENLSSPWTNIARDRLEICFDLYPDISNMIPYGIGSDVLVPVNKVNDIQLYDPDHLYGMDIN